MTTDDQMIEEYIQFLRDKKLLADFEDSEEAKAFLKEEGKEFLETLRKKYGPNFSPEDFKNHLQKLEQEVSTIKKTFGVE